MAMTLRCTYLYHLPRRCFGRFGLWRPLLADLRYDDLILSRGKNDHIDHVMTQLPLACFVAVISCAGYLIAGITESMLLSLILTAVIFFASSFALKVLL